MQRGEALESRIAALEPLSDDKEMKLLIEGVACAFDRKAKTFYYPISGSASEGELRFFDMSFGLEDEEIHVGNKELGALTALPVRRNEPYDITVIAGSGAASYRLVFTSLPILEFYASERFNVVGQIIGADSPGDMRLLDPQYALHEFEEIVLSSPMLLAHRGGASLGYDKKNYKFELVDDEGDEQNAALLGMRSDGDWMLEGVYNDFAKMRKKVSMELWRDISTVYYDPSIKNGPDGRYVEVFVNDSYEGLYLLHERVDRKLLGLSKNEDGESGGFLYKAYTWQHEGKRFVTFYDSPHPITPESRYWGGFEAQYPRLADVGWVNWEPINEFAKFIATTPGNVFSERIGDYIDYGNVIDYYLFLNLVAADDNTGKNIFWSIADTGDPARDRLMMTAWDLDAAWGRDWMSIARPSKGTLDNKLYQRLIALNPDRFVERLKQRWTELRQGAFSLESLRERFSSEYEFLLSSGALEREKARWDGALAKQRHWDIVFHVVDVEPEIEYIHEWIEERLDFLDDYFASLGQGE